MGRNVYKRVNGAWVADKYYQYQQNTATVENSKTIPMYSNGSNLTEYSFEGQCNQALTPTPSSPVEVKCFGDYISQSAIDNILTNTTLTITEPTPTLSTSGVGRVTVTATRGVPRDSGLTIKETGFIYVKDTSVTTALILENVGKDGISKNLAGTSNGSKTVNFTDPDGKGVRVVTYAIVTDGTYVIRIYSQEAKATYQELKDEQEQGTTVSHLYPAPDNVTHIGEYQIPITSNDTKQFIYLTEPLCKIGNYADSVNSEGVVTRKIKKLVLTGEEGWGQFSDKNIFIALSPNQSVAWTQVSSTHFTPSQIQTNGSLLWFVYNNVDFDTTDECKQYLAAQYANGTPVTVYYVLTTSTTESVTAPTIPTSSGFSNIEIGTSIAPSKFTYDLGKMFVGKGQEKVRMNGEWV